MASSLAIGAVLQAWEVAWFRVARETEAPQPHVAPLLLTDQLFTAPRPSGVGAI